MTKVMLILCLEALFGFAILAGGASLACWALFKAGILRKVWHFGAALPALAVILPVMSIWEINQAMAACRLEVTLNCSGGIGEGLALMALAWTVFFALVIGPALGIRLGRRCLRAKGRNPK